MNSLRQTASAAMQQAAVVVLLLARGVSQLFDLRDIFWIGGLAATGYGIAQIHTPAAWIVCGTAVFWMGVRR